MKRIQSKLHRTGMYEVCKVCFSYFDEKRYVFWIFVWLKNSKR